MKYIKILSLFFIVLFLTGAKKSEIFSGTIYLADKNSMTLMPVTKMIYASSKEELSNKIADRLLVYQSDPDILDIIPPEIEISVSDTCAVVDFKELPDFGKNSERELLTIYSLVNSLTSSGDIITVKFTVNGEELKSFNGKIDMRETFIPDYDICS